VSVLTPLTETLPAWKARIWNENPETVMIGTILLILLILLLIGALPNFGYVSGYGPSGGIGLLLIIVIVLFLLGKI
jgi:hypothetical protein